MLLLLVGQLPGGQLQLHEPPLELVDLLGHALQLHRQAAGRLVHQVDRLVRQEAVGDVAVRQLGRGDEGRVLDLHALVMGLVPRLEPAEDGDRVLDGRLADEHRLEPPLEGRVLLDVLAVLVERRGADAPQLAAGERRLEQVGRVVAALGGAGADDRVQLVDEQNDAALRVLHLAEHGLEPLLELAAELRAGDEGAHVERDHPLVLEALRHVAVDDAQGEPLDDRRLADARLADEHGVVLGPPRQHLDDAADFLVAADHRVELALLGPLDEVDAVLLERLELVLGRLVGDAGRAADLLHRGEQLLLADGVELERVLGLRLGAGQREQQVLGRDELVLQLRRRRLGGVEHAAQVAAELRRRPAAGLRQMRQLGVDHLPQLRRS